MVNERGGGDGGRQRWQAAVVDRLWFSSSKKEAWAALGSMLEARLVSLTKIQAGEGRGRGSVTLQARPARYDGERIGDANWEAVKGGGQQPAAGRRGDGQRDRDEHRRRATELYVPEIESRRRWEQRARGGGTDWEWYGDA